MIILLSGCPSGKRLQLFSDDSYEFSAAEEFVVSKNDQVPGWTIVENYKAMLDKAIWMVGPQTEA